MELTFEDLQKDEFLKKFTDETISVSDHVAKLLNLNSSNLSTQITQLSNSIAKLDQFIYAQVTNNHGDLLAQTENVEMMEKMVESCHARANACQIDKLHSQVNNLYNEYEAKVIQLENYYQARQAIRRVKKVFEIDSKIDNQKHNLAEIATNISQIEYLCTQEPPLTILKGHLEKATSLRQNIEKQTENMLMQGLNSNSYAQIPNAIQIFVNLNVLESKTNKIFSDIEKTIERDVKNALQIRIQQSMDLKGKGPGRGFNTGHGSNINTQISNQIWSNLDSLSLKILSNCEKVKLLWGTITKEKDCLSNLRFSESLDVSKWQKFWNNLLDILLHHFCSIKIDFINTTFEKEFPRLLKLFTNLGKKIEDSIEFPELKINFQSGLRGVLSNYEKGFLSKSLAKLFDAVNGTFSNGNPTKKGIDSLIKIMFAELNTADDLTLKKLISRNISKTISLICVRSEQLIVNDGNSTQVIGPATESQISNAGVLNNLEYLKSQCLSMSIEVEGIEPLMNNSISSLIDGIFDAIEAIILTMHNENFQRRKATEYSLYMGELQSFIFRANKDYLSLFESVDLVQLCGRKLAERTIELFTWNVSMLNSIKTNSTKTQIFADINQLEVALTPICPVLSELGRSFKMLRGFKSLLMLKSEEFSESNLLGQAVPFSMAVHVMLSFSNGDLKLPHLSNGWSVTRYSKWLDEHKQEKDRLQLLASTLETYVHNVTSSGKAEFDPIYPHVFATLQKGLNANHNS